MVRIVEREPKLSLCMNVLTDVQFWVPVLVLIAGLVLLRAIR
jgi:hypothetical protein